MLLVGLLSTTGADPYPGKKITGSKKKNSIVNNIVNEILLGQKVSATNHEAPEFLESDYGANDLYQVEKMSLEETKENLE